MVKLKGRKGSNEIRLFILQLFVKQALQQPKSSINTPTLGIREIFDEVKAKYKIRQIRGVNSHLNLLKSRGYIHYDNKLRKYYLSEKYYSNNRCKTETLLLDFVDDFNIFTLDQPIYELLTFLRDMFPNTLEIPLDPFFTIMENRREIIYGRQKGEMDEEENRAKARRLWSNTDEMEFELSLINFLFDLHKLSHNISRNLYRWAMFEKLSESHKVKKGDALSSISSFLEEMRYEYYEKTKGMIETFVKYVARLNLLKEEKTLNNFYKLFIDIIDKCVMLSMDKNVKEYGEVLEDIRDETDHVEEEDHGYHVYKKPFTMDVLEKRIESKIWQRRRNTHSRKTLKDRTKFYFYKIGSTDNVFLSSKDYR